MFEKRAANLSDTLSVCESTSLPERLSDSVAERRWMMAAQVGSPLDCLDVSFCRPPVRASGPKTEAIEKPPPVRAGVRPQASQIPPGLLSPLLRCCLGSDLLFMQGGSR